MEHQQECTDRRTRCQMWHPQLSGSQVSFLSLLPPVLRQSLSPSLLPLFLLSLSSTPTLSHPFLLYHRTSFNSLPPFSILSHLFPLSLSPFPPPSLSLSLLPPSTLSYSFYFLTSSSTLSLSLSLALPPSLLPSFLPPTLSSLNSLPFQLFHIKSISHLSAIVASFSELEVWKATYQCLTPLVSRSVSGHSHQSFINNLINVNGLFVESVLCEECA